MNAFLYLSITALVACSLFSYKENIRLEHLIKKEKNIAAMMENNWKSCEVLKQDSRMTKNE